MEKDPEFWSQFLDYVKLSITLLVKKKRKKERKKLKKKRIVLVISVGASQCK